MSDSSLARRTAIQVFFAGVDITSSLQKYLLSLTYTDNEEDETDDLQIKMHDRDGVWIEKWLNSAIQAAAENEATTTQITRYKVTASSGLAVRSRAGNQYYQYGTLAYGTIIDVASISGGWANFTYSGKNAYCNASYLQAITTTKNGTSGDYSKGLHIQAAIVRQNWNGNGKDDLLECGQFELDNITAQGPPSTITIKGTSLPYKASIRQTLKSKSWEKYTLSGIGNEIASKNGMTCMFLSSSDPSYTRVEQYRVSDIAFLQKLCNDAGCSLKVSNNILVIFDQAQYEKKATVLTISKGSGYEKYKLSTGENDTYTSCRVSYTLSNGTVISATEYIDDYDEKSEKNQCLEIHQKVSSISEAKTLAQKMLRLHNKYELSASFTFPGDPTLLAGCTVKLTGFGAWNGTYIIKQAKHKVDQSGYTTQITLRKALAAEQTSVPVKESNTAVKETEPFAVGDMVMCNSGVTKYYNGVNMAKWVPTTVLFVRAVEQGGKVLLVSTEKTAPVYTGRVWATDVHKA